MTGYDACLWATAFAIMGLGCSAWVFALIGLAICIEDRGIYKKLEKEYETNSQNAKKVT